MLPRTLKVQRFKFYKQKEEIDNMKVIFTFDKHIRRGIDFLMSFFGVNINIVGTSIFYKSIQCVYFYLRVNINTYTLYILKFQA